MIGIICFLIVTCLAVGIGLSDKGSNSEEKTVSISNQETVSATAEESSSSIKEDKTESVFVSEKNSSTEKSTEKASSTSNKAETKTTERVTNKEIKPAVTKNQVQQNSTTYQQTTVKNQSQQNSTTKKQTVTDKTTKNLSISFSINCEKAVEYGASVSNYLIKPTKCKVKDGTTVFDLLDEMCRENGIAMVHQNKSYIKSIGGLSEKDCGSTSGWMYLVNGQKLNMSAAKYALKDGDTVEWYYVTSPTD